MFPRRCFSSLFPVLLALLSLQTVPAQIVPPREIPERRPERQRFPDSPEPDPRSLVGDLVPLRIATFNIEDVRTEHIADESNERLKKLAAVIQHIQPDILFLNEIQYDGSADKPGGHEATDSGRNAQRFADTFLKKPQEEGLHALSFRAVMLPSNTGVPSGFDLDNNGRIENKPGSRDYGGDCLGYGEFPGQFAMALLVREDLDIVTKQIRTFRTFKWKDMPGASLPPSEGNGAAKVSDAGWYTPAELAILPLSSKSHWDIPILLRNGAVIHALCSHPTPPVFDGPEDRNGRRNHDEIRFWADYIAGQGYMTDDRGEKGGLGPNESFVILGDLNADPIKGDSRGRPMDPLLKSLRVNVGIVPRSRTPVENLTLDATSHFRLRVDYVLPSGNLLVTGSGIWRGLADSPGAPEGTPEFPIHDAPSDHFPVWVDVNVPGPRMHMKPD